MKNLKKNLFLAYWLIKQVGLTRILLNIAFNIFIDSEKKILITNFTSRIINQKNLFYSKDLLTLSSLASSFSCYIQANNKVFLGKNILFGPSVKIISSNHGSKNRNYLKTDPIKIGNNVWIGANAVILPGIEIGSNSIIGAGAVVTKSFKEEKIVLAGNPAKVVKRVK